MDPPAYGPAYGPARVRNPPAEPVKSARVRNLPNPPAGTCTARLWARPQSEPAARVTEPARVSCTRTGSRSTGRTRANASTGYLPARVEATPAGSERVAAG
jgi:hypothetical protein